MVPAYNKERSIEEVLTSYSGYLERRFKFHEIIVVCDGVTDRTPEIGERLSKQDRRIRLLKFPERLGKGGATIEGFRHAGGDLVGFVDADPSTKPSELGKLLDGLDSGIHAAIGSRRGGGAVLLSKPPLLRRLFSRGFNCLVRLLFKLPFRDTQCGAKVFRGAALQEVLPDMVSRGFEFDVELLWRLKRRGYEIREVPIEWTYDPSSTFGLRFIPQMAASLLEVRFARLSTPQPR